MAVAFKKSSAPALPPEVAGTARTFWFTVLGDSVIPLYSPFGVCLASGTLIIESFRLFVAQEEPFLEAVSRAYVAAAEYAEDDAAKSAIYELRKGVFHELIKYDSFVQEWGFNIIKKSPMNPATLKLTKFLERTACGRIEALPPGILATPFEKTKIAAYALAALTACMLLYAYLGKELKRLAGLNLHNHPYRKWIEKYSSESFQASVMRTEGLLDELSASLTGDELKVIEKLYQQAMKLEIEFFYAQPVVQPSVAPLIKKHDPAQDRLVIFAGFDLTCTEVDSAAVLAEMAIVIAPKSDESQLEEGESDESQLEEGEISQLEEGESDESQLEEGEISQLEKGKISQLEKGEVSQLEEGEISQLEKGEVSQLEEGEGSQLEEGEGEVSQLEEGEGSQLEEGEGEVSQLEEGEIREKGEVSQLEEGEGEVSQLEEGEIARMSATEVKSKWNLISTQYTKEYEKCIRRILRTDKVEFNYQALHKALEPVADFEKRANSRVIESGLLKGINLENIKRTGEHLNFQRDCNNFFQKITKNENLNANIHIISYCWCADLIRAAFSSGGLDGLNIHANEFIYEESVCTGEFVRKVQSPHDKVQAFDEILQGYGNDRKNLTVYIGDAMGDLLCLLKADIGIVVGSSASLEGVGRRYGITFLPLLSGLVKKQMELADGRPSWKGQSGILYTASGWNAIHAFILGW